MSIPTGWEHTVAERLSLAAENGHGGVVKLLLERGGVSSDGPEGWDQTPLSLNLGQTPALIAPKNGHHRAVKLPLGREDINPNRPENYGKTLLLWAVKDRHEGMEELLEARKSGTSGVV